MLSGQADDESIECPERPRGQIGGPQICTALVIGLEVGLPGVGGSNQILGSTELAGALGSNSIPLPPPGTSG